MEKQILIFLKNGETLLFQDVSNVDVTDEYVAFDYFGKSTNQEKSGAFYFDNIAGWSAKEKNMLEKAKQLASQELSRLSGREIKPEDCYVVWFSKTLQNWKALVGTNQIKSDEKCGDYAEVTHNGDKAETYVDVYAKVSNRAIKD